MDLIRIRKFQIVMEEILHEGGPAPARPRRRGAIAVVLKNPYAGRYVEEITPLMEAMKEMGKDMAARLVAALGVSPGEIEAYGKGSIVGGDGELEHGALWHVPGGYGMREILGGAKAIVPSAKKVGAIGAAIDVPIHHVNAAYVRSPFDAMEVRVPAAPRADELVFALAMTTGPRVHARVGGLQASEIKGEDGLR